MERIHSIDILSAIVLGCAVESCRSPEPEEYHDPDSMYCVKEMDRGPDGKPHEALVLQRRLTPEELASYEAKAARSAVK